MLYVTWFAAALRMIDISDPARPAERGHFIPQPAAGRDVPWTNDVSERPEGADFRHRQGLWPRCNRDQRVIWSENVSCFDDCGPLRNLRDRCSECATSIADRGSLRGVHFLEQRKKTHPAPAFFWTALPS